MKRSSLTNPQRELLEALLAAHGPVVTSDQIARQLSHQNAQSTRRLISTLVQAGWLVRIRKGLYQIADIGALGTLTLSRWAIAQLLVPESYISFQAALQYGGFFDQGLRSIPAVSLKQRADVEIEGSHYSFVKTQVRYFFGFTEELMNGRRVRVATPEKALLDVLQFKRSQANVDLVMEILREDAHLLDFTKLVQWAQQLPVAVQRVVGYLLDVTGHAAGEQLVDSATHASSVTWLSSQSSVYNHKWRLYVDPCFTYQERNA